MLRFRIALIAYAVRRILPLAFVVFGIGGAIVLRLVPFGSSLSGCFSRAYSTAIYCPGGGSGSDSFGWLIPLVPLAVPVGVVGLVLAAVAAFWNRHHPPIQPLPPLPAGWRTGGRASPNE